MLLTLAALSWCQGGCRRSPPVTAREVDPLDLIPAEARFVAAIDLARVREAPVTAKLALSKLLVEKVEAFGKELGFDLWRDVDRVTAGAASYHAGGLVLRGRGLDEARLTAQARSILRAKGDELLARQRGRRTFWSPRSRPDVAGVFLDGRTLLLGAGGWAEKMADLADGPVSPGRAAPNPELARLAGGVSAHAIWLAGTVPDDARRALRVLSELLAVHWITVWADPGKGLAASLTAELASAQLARTVAQVAGAGLAGLGFPAATARALQTTVDGSTVQLALALDESQVQTIPSFPEVWAARNVPPMRRYAEKLVSTSGAKVTLGRCDMVGTTRAGFCLLEGPPREIAAFATSLGLTRRGPGQRPSACLELDGFGKRGIQEHRPRGALPLNSDNVRLVTVYTAGSSACVEMEYPYG